MKKNTAITCPFIILFCKIFSIFSQVDTLNPLPFSSYYTNYSRYPFPLDTVILPFTDPQKMFNFQKNLISNRIFYDISYEEHPKTKLIYYGANYNEFFFSISHVQNFLKDLPIAVNFLRWQREENTISGNGQISILETSFAYNSYDTSLIPSIKFSTFVSNSLLKEPNTGIFLDASSLNKNLYLSTEIKKKLLALQINFFAHTSIFNDYFPDLNFYKNFISIYSLSDNLYDTIKNKNITPKLYINLRNFQVGIIYNYTQINYHKHIWQEKWGMCFSHSLSKGILYAHFLTRNKTFSDLEVSFRSHSLDFNYSLTQINKFNFYIPAIDSLRYIENIWAKTLSANFFLTFQKVKFKSSFYIIKNLIYIDSVGFPQIAQKTQWLFMPSISINITDKNSSATFYTFYNKALPQASIFTIPQIGIYAYLSHKFPIKKYVFEIATNLLLFNEWRVPFWNPVISNFQYIHKKVPNLYLLSSSFSFSIKNFKGFIVFQNWNFLFKNYGTYPPAQNLFIDALLLKLGFTWILLD